MSLEHVAHKDIKQFAIDRVNLPADKASVYRAQVRRVRELLEKHVADHPEFVLKKMQLSGSLAKGTALRSLNDIDVALYLSGDDAPHKVSELLEYIAQNLRKIPNLNYDQVNPQTYSVCVSFKGTGLDVDIVPILYYGDPDWRGDLISQDDGSRLMTSIPMHLDFAKKRKVAQPTNFAQVARLVKYWASIQKDEISGFRFKSFMIEMILAHLCDNGVDFSDYPDVLSEFFNYLATTELRRTIAFTDNYSASAIDIQNDRVRIVDPVNPANNVGRLYDDHEVGLIVDAAYEAGDAIDYALRATTKGETIAAWQRVFGSTFSVS
tara:strand:+ start:5430 stop:6395 length:966 start_codon:yes stop_codon:yes gene_type:complete